MEHHVGPELRQVVHATDAALRGSPQDVTLRELAAMLDRDEAGAAPPRS
jgi:hypothetical protein